MARKQPTMQALNVNKGKKGMRLSAERYHAVKEAILAALPPGEEGLLFKDLPGEVASRVPAGLFEGASIAWYTTSVKLDLEARGLIERVPGSRPQRLRRAQEPGRAGG